MSNIWVLADAILGSTTVKQITQSDFSSNQEHRKGMESGGNAISLVSGKSQADVTSFTTADLATLLAVGTNTYCSAGVSLLSSTITFPKKFRSAGASFKALPTNHANITGSNALIVPTSIEASQDGDFATMSSECHWLSADGFVDAVSDTASYTLVAQTYNREFALGPVTINGSAVPGVQSIRITPGLEVVKPPTGKGAVFPVFASIKSITPTMEITVNDFAAVAGTVGNFTAMTAAVVYLRRRADSGEYTGSSTDISLTFAAGLADTNNISASGNDDGSATITLHGKTLTASVAATSP